MTACYTAAVSGLRARFRCAGMLSVTLWSAHVVVVARAAAVVRVERPFEQRGPRLVALGDRFDPPRFGSS